MFSCTKGSNFSFVMFKIASKHPQNTESKFYNLNILAMMTTPVQQSSQALRQLRPTIA